MTRTEGFATQCHSGFLGRPVSFLIVAADAGRHKVGPLVAPAPGAWNDMIHRQTLTLIAVLATKTIPAQDILAGQHDAPEWHTDVVPQPDNARPSKLMPGRAQSHMGQGFHQIGLVQVYQHERPLYTTHS